jgi:hypothetical protein
MVAAHSVELTGEALERSYDETLRRWLFALRDAGVPWNVAKRLVHRLVSPGMPYWLEIDGVMMRPEMRLRREIDDIERQVMTAGSHE